MDKNRNDSGTGRGKVIQLNVKPLRTERLKTIWEAVESVIRAHRFGNRPFKEETVRETRFKISRQTSELCSSACTEFYGLEPRKPTLLELSNLFEDFVLLFACLGRSKEYSVLSRLEELDSLRVETGELIPLLEHISREVLLEEMSAWNGYCKLLVLCRTSVEEVAMSVLVRYHIEKSASSFSFLTSPEFIRAYSIGRWASDFIKMIIRQCDCKTAAELPVKVTDVLTRIELYYRNHKKIDII